MLTQASQQTELWAIDKFVPYVRNPRKNDAAVDRMCASIREFGFKIPCLVRSDGEVVDGGDEQWRCAATGFASQDGCGDFLRAEFSPGEIGNPLVRVKF